MNCKHCGRPFNPELESVIREQLGRVVANALTTGVPSRGMFNRAIEAITAAAGAPPPPPLPSPPPPVHLLTGSLDTACGQGGQRDGYSSARAEVTCGDCLGGG